MNQLQEIKRLLRLSEIAQAKVEFNFSGTKVVNPAQQAAASRLYNKAYALKPESMDALEFTIIHRQVMDELKQGR